MLFNSYAFLFIYLPITFILFALVQSFFKLSGTIIYLFAASILFYGYWNLTYLPLLLASILFNFGISVLMKGNNKLFFYLGVFSNIGLLVYFKYSQFLVTNLYWLMNQPIELINGDLPLGISFFTFTQIAYLTDCYRKQMQPASFSNYGLFVTFFPHLMAGPILHHQEIMPQFQEGKKRLLSWDNIALGIAIFSIGLFKKSIIADSLAPYANTLFDAAAKGPVTFIDAWSGMLSYTFQIYFDFSGYSDMAIGLARIFGIIFPLNFNSPYKANNIINFWRQWHMTLSRFLRDYVYIPLGGSRQGNIRRYMNLILTMLIGGFWHGAAWTFIIWGMLHGSYLVINHLWIALKDQYLKPVIISNAFINTLIARSLTFLAVTLAWVFFRAETFQEGRCIIHAMSSFNNLSSQLYPAASLESLLELLLGCSILAFFAPNTQQLFHQYKPALETYPGEIKPYPVKIIQWSPNAWIAVCCAILTIISLLSFGQINEFLYYKF